MSKIKCDVCNLESAGVVMANSRLASARFAYCPKCMSSEAEPYYFLASVVAMDYYEELKSLNDLTDWFDNIVSATLLVTGKTTDQFIEDVNVNIRMEEEEEFFWEQCDFDDDDEFFK